MNVMIVHVLYCNLFLYKLFMHACVVAESTLCTLSSVLLSFSLSNNPLESTSTRSQNITPTCTGERIAFQSGTASNYLTPIEACQRVYLSWLLIKPFGKSKCNVSTDDAGPRAEAINALCTRLYYA